jgi:regulatory protein
MDLLSRREHSRFELTRKLHERKFEADVIKATLDKLEADHLLSDVRFTEAYIKMRSGRGFGPVRIEQELLERGVNDFIIHDMLKNQNWHWKEVIAYEQHKKFKQMPKDFTEKAKQSQFLYYRGFTPEQINAVFRGG